MTHHSLSTITLPEPVKNGARGYVLTEDGTPVQVIYQREEREWSANGRLINANSGEVLAYGDAMTHYRGGEQIGYLWADLTAYLIGHDCRLPLRRTYGGDWENGKLVNPPSGQIVVRFPLDN